MARQVDGPWFRVSKGTWYVTTDDGLAVSLKVRGRGAKQEAMAAWHRLMTGGSSQAPARPPQDPPAGEVRPKCVTVGEVVSAFLREAESRVSPDAHRGYGKFLKPFVLALGKRDADGLTAEDVDRFLTQRTTWGATYKAGFHATASQMMRWAVAKGHASGNVLDGVKKPRKQSRGAKATLTAEEHRRLLDFADAETKDLLAVLWATGARPSEVAGITSAMVRASRDGVIVLEEHKTSHKGKQRHLILSGEAWAIVQRRAVERTGLIFRGQNGRLTATAIGLRMTRLCRKAGLRHCIPYGYRHSYATDALANGVPDATVAALLGHCDTSMIHRHYSHLSARTQTLQAAALQVRG